AYTPRSLGRGKVALRPVGELTTTSSTCCQEETALGSGPSWSSRRRAPVVRPSPQILSRGNVALSTTVTARPARARVIAAAAPAGPAPTRRTSGSAIVAEGTTPPTGRAKPLRPSPPASDPG